MTVDCLAQLCVTARLRLIVLFRRFQVPLQFFSQAMAAYSCLRPHENFEIDFAPKPSSNNMSNMEVIRWKFVINLFLIFGEPYVESRGTKVS